MESCPCGSDSGFAKCCGPVISGERAAQTAEELMRSRYSAFVKGETDFLLESTHPDQREKHDKKTIEKWAGQSQWLGFTLLATSDGTAADEEGSVEFVAEYRERGMRKRHHELATFKKKDGTWYFYDGQPAPQVQVVREEPKIGRNAPCPCGSGRKYKKCCGK